MLLASHTGTLCVNKPYTSHITVPNVNSRYILSEIAEVSRVLIVFTACGKKESVVQKAATIPEIKIQFIKRNVDRVQITA